MGSSAEEQAKSQDWGKEAKQDLDTAFPYFQMSEAMNPNDMSTLIALNAILNQKGDTAGAKEFERRLQVVRSGEMNKGSFYKR